MNEDTWLIAMIFVVWMVLSILFFTVPMIYMPTTGRVWGLGALVFLVLAVVAGLTTRKGGRHSV